MPVYTSDGKTYEDDFSFWHERMFGPQQEDAGGDNKLFMVRHGDTDCNDEDLVHGWVNQSLNERGIEQAHKSAESLKDKGITRIVSSDLPRAKQTANIISKVTGAPVTFDPNLRTWDAGDFDYTDKHKEFDAYAKQAENRTMTIPEIDSLEQPDVANSPERIPEFVDKYGEIAVWPKYETEHGSNTKVQDWLNKGNLPSDIEREDIFESGDARHFMILRKKNLKAQVG